jgi:hypothetical protein
MKFLIAILVLIAGIWLFMQNKNKSAITPDSTTTTKPSSSHKYVVGDVLCNPPDYVDTFKITSIQIHGDYPFYNFYQPKSETGFSERCDLVDNFPGIWKKVKITGTSAPYISPDDIDTIRNVDPTLADLIDIYGWKG